MERPQITAEDVARAAGVSRSTVSRAFSPGRPVNPATRRKILQAAKQLGYQPNALAQALISQKSQIVGIVMGGLSNSIHAVIHESITRRLQAAGYIPITAQLGPNVEIDDVIVMFRKYQVSAVLLTSMDITQAMIQACLDASLKVCLLNRMDDLRAAASVCADVERGGTNAAVHLIERGRESVAVFAGAEGSWTSAARRAGHLTGLARGGLKPWLDLPGGYRYEDGIAAATTLIQNVRDNSRPDAVLCPNDLFACGLMDRLRIEHGISVPDEIAVVGFDDNPMAAWESYNLTTMRLPVESITERSIDMIERMINGDEQLSEVVWMPCRLMERGTV